METVGALLRDASGTDAERVASTFDQVAAPAGLVYSLGLEPEGDRDLQNAPLPADPSNRLVVLAGPGVVSTGSIDGLRAFASAANAPVANTWGAKGVFAWDSPHHMGTCGLQARDFELLGFANYDSILATGIDLAESPRELFELAPVAEIAPTTLGRLATRVTPATKPILPNELYARLSKIAQPGFVDERVPLHPARAVADLRAALPPGGIVAADPGIAGLWVARTFPTTEPGTVVVPAVSTPGVAAAIALIASLRGHPAIAATAEPIDHATLGVLELATEVGASLVVDVWGAGGPVRRAEDHLDHLRSAATGVAIVDVPVDPSLTRRLVDAAGPVVAWGGLLSSE